MTEESFFLFIPSFIFEHEFLIRFKLSNPTYNSKQIIFLLKKLIRILDFYENEGKKTVGRGISPSGHIVPERFFTEIRLKFTNKGYDLFKDSNFPLPHLEILFVLLRTSSTEAHYREKKSDSCPIDRFFLYVSADFNRMVKKIYLSFIDFFYLLYSLKFNSKQIWVSKKFQFEVYKYEKLRLPLSLEYLLPRRFTNTTSKVSAPCSPQSG